MNDDLSRLAATAYDIPVVWAVDPSDVEWRTSGVDRFLRWAPEQAYWGAVQRRAPDWAVGLSPVAAPREYRGRLLAVHPEGLGLVMESTRMLVLLPLGALRVEGVE